MAKQVALYKLPEILETAKILDSSILPRFKESVRVYNLDKARQTLDIFSESDSELANSNPFALVHLTNSGLLPKGSRLAERNHLETAVSFDNSFLKGNYADIGLALRTEGDSYSSNDLLAKELAEQLKQRGIKLNKGRLIPLNVLKLKEDRNSDYGLVFALNDNVSKENILDLSQFKWDYKAEDGLARVYLDSDRDWGSNYRDLAYSDACGRVVVVSAEGTAQKTLEEQLAKLQRTRDEEIANIQKRYSQAENILRGK